MNEPEVILGMLRGAGGSPRTLAVVGLSSDAAKPSHSVSAYMQRNGFRLLPVNPGETEILSERCYPTLAALPERPDVVNVFRLPKFIPAIVEEMIALGLRDLWVQLGIVNRGAAERAEAAGLRVVMDRCILIEHRRRPGSGHAWTPVNWAVLFAGSLESDGTKGDFASPTI